MPFKPVLAQMFLAQFDKTVNEMCVKSRELTDLCNYDRISLNIRSLSKSEFGSHVKVHFFGSRVIGLATDESDLDIFIELDENFFYNNKTSEKKEQNFFKMKSAIDFNGNWRIKDYLPKASIPIIICVYRPMQLNCDINFVNGLSVCNSKLLQHLFCIQPQAVALYHSLRQWMKIQEFDHLKGYTMTLLVLFYLQQKNYMPSIHTVQRNLPKIKIDGCECQFDPTRNLGDYQVKKIWSYKPLIKGFFHFYSEFNFDKVISPYKGSFVNKIRYKSYYPSFYFKGIFIAGPINQAKNCGIMNVEDKEQFIQLCKSSTEYFQNLYFKMSPPKMNA